LRLRVMNPFKKTEKPDVAQVAKEGERALKKEGRGLDRELARLEAEEQKVLREIKDLARKGDTKSAKIMAKNVVAIRATKSRLIGVKGHTRAMESKMVQMKCNAALTGVVAKQLKVMQQVNAAMSPQEVARQAALLQRESAKQELIDECMNDMFEGMDEDDMELEADMEVNKVLDELAIDVGGQLPSVPGQALPAARQSNDAEMDRLLAQLSA